MRKIIINADDCGISEHVNACIEDAIKLGCISSTTIIANMSDFEGAVRLFNLYHDHISFGWHINLDEGAPLTSSQLLLDKGFFIEVEGKIKMNGSGFRYAYFSSLMKKEIERELLAQWEKLNDYGIKITHADSHHFIHSQPSMIQIIPALLEKLKIERCRHVANYGFTGISKLARSIWASFFKLHGIRMPDTFCAFSDYYNNRFFSQGDSIELMCHPGHNSTEYQKEFELVKTTDVKEWGQSHFIL